MAGVDLLEAEPTEQTEPGRIVFADLGLNERKVLIVIAAEHVAQQQAGQSLTTQPLLDLDVQDADGMLVPPARTDLFEGGDGETRVRVRFRTQATWRLDGRHPEPWRVLPDPWPRPSPPAPPHRLGPRRRY